MGGGVRNGAEEEENGRAGDLGDIERISSVARGRGRGRGLG